MKFNFLDMQMESILTEPWAEGVISSMQAPNLRRDTQVPHYRVHNRGSLWSFFMLAFPRYLGF